MKRWSNKRTAARGWTVSCGLYARPIRSSVQGLIERDLVRVDGRAVKNSYRVKAGERVEVVLPPPESTEVEPEPIPLDIVYEDSSLLVINKPAGMVVHPPSATGPVHWSMRCFTTPTACRMRAT